MELEIKPYHQNSYPIGGIWMRGHSIGEWLTNMEAIGLSLERVKVYPLPGNEANTTWGCLLELPVDSFPKDIGPHVYCQLANNLLFLPVNANIHPTVSALELQVLMGNKRHCYHPTIGWVQLPEPLDFSEHLILPTLQPTSLRQPAKSPYIPNQVKNFQVHQPPLEEVLEIMDDKLFPEKKTLEDKPLNLLEKVKLGLLRSLFAPKDDTGKYSSAAGGKRRKWLENISKLLVGKKMDALAERLQNHYEDLEQRNQKIMDKLLDMFKNNPDEALKYAIPIDTDGTSRGGEQAANLSKLWGNFSLFNNNVRFGDGAATIGDSHLRSLINQYHDTATELKKKKEYTKAAFVYLKLLKNPHMAAESLAEGGLFAEAAAIYIKHCNNLQLAATCYERGHMTQQAIDVYKQLGQDEKVGDLYLSLNDKDSAYHYFDKVTTAYENAHQYVKAAVIHKEKMQDMKKAQQLLLTGWRQGSDASNCLYGYLNNIDNEAELVQTIANLYKDETTAANQVKFLGVLQNQYNRGPNAAECTRDIAYEIIAQQAVANPDIVSELKHFNKTDKNLIKDVLKYKQVRRKRFIH
jgi:MoxR-vWA-beta-propeller ternary system domain bpX3